MSLMKTILIELLLLLSSYIYCFVSVQNKDWKDDTNELNKQFFSEWTEWSACSNLCEKYREKYCEYSIKGYRKMFHKCSFEVVRETFPCNDVSCLSTETSSTSQGRLHLFSDKCGKFPFGATVNEKIMGGRHVNGNKWPWFVKLGKMNFNQVFYNCGATLISNAWAITAAHCLNKYIKKYQKLGELIKFNNETILLQIRYNQVGTYFGTERIVYVSHFAVHPLYFDEDHMLIYDFALIRLAEPLKNVTFPCISTKKDFQLTDGSTCFAVGWEQQLIAQRDSENSTFIMDDNRLYEVELPLISSETCQAEYKNIYINYDVHVCAGSFAKDTCEGDSGSGLFCLNPETKDWMLYGVTSFGSNLGCGLTPGVYARMSAAISWVTQMIGKHN